MRRWFIFISFSVGLLSLGQEIVWVKLISFLGKSVPQAFSFVLFVYVLGIAIGAYKGRELLNSNCLPQKIISQLLLYSSLAAFLAPIIITWTSGQFFSIIPISLLILWGAAFKGAIFPLLHHWCSQPGKNLGGTLSTVYFANVFGASLGPILVGFWLLDKIPLIELLVYIGCIEFFIAILMTYKSLTKYTSYQLTVISLLCLFSLFYAPHTMLKIITNSLESNATVQNIIENKHGIIYTVHNNEKKIDQIYGGNVYDGAFSVDLTTDVNKIERAYLIPLLHKSPKKVLFIGLSSGSWLRVIASIPEVTDIDVVEINPAYPEIMQNFSGAEILQDKRINFIYGDGRQVVRQAIQSEKKYDLIVMNTTWHWRAYTTNLLSIDFFNMIKKVSKQNTVFAFNSTSSKDVFYTASKVFKYSYIFRNFIYNSDSDLIAEQNNNRERICLLKADFIEGQSCKDEIFLKSTDKIKNAKLIRWEDIKYNGRPLEIVTDDNMIIEYKYGKAFVL